MAEFAGTESMKVPVKYMSSEEIDDALLKGIEEAVLLNAPKSREFVMNNRQQVLNVRSYWPLDVPGAASPEVRAFVLNLHGFALHSNRPTEQFVGQTFTSHGIGFITMDFHGHGYSEGRKCSINHGDDVIDDVLSVLLALFAEGNEASDHSLARTTKGVPFFIMGHSMGGAAALLVSNMLSIDFDAKVSTVFAKDNLAKLAAFVTPSFRGTLLLSPMVKLPSFVKPVVQSLGRIMPNSTLPRLFRNDEDLCKSNWSSAKFSKYVISDCFPNSPHGLTYWGGARVNTLRSLCTLVTYVKESMTQFSFAFIVFHDTGDNFVKSSGSQQLMAAAPSHDKKLLEVPGGLHDPLTNRVDFVCQLAMDWMGSRLSS